MPSRQRQSHPLSYYLAQTYPYTVVPDDGSFFIEFPDLPGCMTQVEEAAEIADMAEEIRTLWIETEYERGAEIPAPTENESFSGKFLVRVPKSLHRDLARAAGRENVSLNAYVTTLLAQRNGIRDLATELASTILAPPIPAGPHGDPDQPRRPHGENAHLPRRAKRSAAH